MWKRTLIEVLYELLLGFGLIFTFSPFFLYWLIHGDYNRYIWIISGPYPFNSFGGGPFQLFMYISLLLIGVLLIYIGIIFRKDSKK